MGAVGKPKDQQVRLYPCAHNQVDKTLLKRQKYKLDAETKGSTRFRTRGPEAVASRAKRGRY